jgi:hypothetical protein
MSPFKESGGFIIGQPPCKIKNEIMSGRQTSIGLEQLRLHPHQHTKSYDNTFEPGIPDIFLNSIRQKHPKVSKECTAVKIE